MLWFLGQIVAARFVHGTLDRDNPHMPNLIAAPGTIQFDAGFDATKGTLTVGIGGTSAGVSYGQFTAIQAVKLGGDSRVEAGGRRRVEV